MKIVNTKCEWCKFTTAKVVGSDSFGIIVACNSCNHEFYYKGK